MGILLCIVSPMNRQPKGQEGFFWAIFPAALAVFYVFVFNSGYGYDALEFLTIGRSLRDGYSFFTFSPHKPWALYYLVDLFFSSGFPADHYGVSLLITLIVGAILAATFLISKRLFDVKMALLSCVFVFLSAIFMELNFLEAEGLSFLSGLLAFYVIHSGLQQKRKLGLVLGGFLIGMGSWFKIITMVYFPAAALFLVFWNYREGTFLSMRSVKQKTLLLSGLLAAMAIPCLLFFRHGDLRTYLYWTYYFPFFGYQTFTFWASKLYTRLSWFFVLFISALGLSFTKGVRNRLYSDDGCVFILFMGVFPLVLLFKSQAPHYLFPAAGFLSIFIAIVFIFALNKTERSSPFGALAMSLVLIGSGMAMGIYLFLSGKISKIKGLSALRDYSYEQHISAAIDPLIPDGGHALFFRDSASLYWISHRYPNVPFLWFDDWATLRLKQDPDALLKALSDPALQLVEFNPAAPGDTDVQDFFLRNHPDNRRILETFELALRTRFTPSTIHIPPYMFWVRKRAAPSS